MDSIKDMLTGVDRIVFDICDDIQSFRDAEEKRKAKELEEKERARLAALKEEELFKDSDQKFLDWMKTNKQNIIDGCSMKMMGCSFKLYEDLDHGLLDVYRRNHLTKLIKRYFENTKLKCLIEGKSYDLSIRFVYRETEIGMK